MGITWKLVQTPSCYFSYMYRFHQGKYYSISWDMVWIQSWKFCCHVWDLTYLHLYDNESNNEEPNEDDIEKPWVANMGGLLTLDGISSNVEGEKDQN
jgi:hypothetical protein